MINGNTELIAHVGFPTFSFRSPSIYNPYFRASGIDAVVVPFSCRPEDFAGFLRPLFSISNVRGALNTMPLKIPAHGLVDELSTAAQIAGSCNAVRRLPDGRLHGDIFDGEGFVGGLRRKGVRLEGARAFILGAGGVGSAIAASLAGAGVSKLSIFDINPRVAEALVQRLTTHYPQLEAVSGGRDPAGHDIVVNATPQGMYEGDEIPLDVSRIDPGAVVGEVVLSTDMTALLRAAQAKGCRVQIGSDMLYEQIPVYLAYFGLPTTTPARLRELSEQATSRDAVNA